MTIFKKIIEKQIPAKIVYEDEMCLAFHDVDPKAPTHILLIPKKEIASLDNLVDEDAKILGHMMLQIPKIAKQLSLGLGYRVVCNTGLSAGQSVFHLHFHILGGRSMTWPPG
jgi:histidine triad (HIT) family protein